MSPRSTVIWILLVFAACSAVAEGQNMYKWIDDQGEVHYGQFPPPGTKTEKMRAPPPAPASAAATAGSDLQKQIEIMNKNEEEQLQGAKDAESWAKIQKIRRENCDTANKNLVNLQRGGNVRYVGPNGEVMRLTEEDRQKRIEEANAQIKENCSP
jgi:hypothetical protein